MPVEVADAVAVGVEEAARVDLVDDAVAPPAGAVPPVVRHAAEASGPPLGAEDAGGRWDAPPPLSAWRRPGPSAGGAR